MPTGVSSYIKPKKRTTDQLDEATRMDPVKPQKQEKQVPAPAPPPEKKWWER